MKQRLPRIFLILSVACSLGVFSNACRAGDAPFFLKDGDRVVFYGDSITAQRLYTTLTETYVVTRFPLMKVDFIDSGWGGDKVSGGGGGVIDVRLPRDVFAHKPTVVTVMLGMNDAGYHSFDDTAFAAFSKGYTHIVDQLESNLPGLRITLIQSSPFDDATRAPMFPGGYNAVLLRYGTFVQQLAAERKLGVVDFNAPVVQALEKANVLDPATAEKVIPDRVHPGSAGHLIMAEALLRSWNAPATVTTVEIDYPGKRVTQSLNSEVSDLNEAKILAWTELDQALPMPVDLDDPATNLILRSSDFTAALNQELLTVKGLTNTNYTLTIDGTSVGNFTGAQLGGGINLALLHTPMAKQAKAVHELIDKHNSLHELRWRSIQVNLGQAKTEALINAMPPMLAGLDAEEADVVGKLRALAQPVPHHYELLEASPLQAAPASPAAH
ncbi:MAG TPA: SGNH/GDSL hydrolase family protein [Opitutaceae bacterium]|jgi:lysophospholipase L1-like esterase|nr:SGNH/GDSL hydrolase family protein [Opitutaceae bacterium]